MDGFVDEIIAEAAKQDIIETRKEVILLIEELKLVTVEGRKASESLISVTSNGQLVNAYNEAAKAQNKLVGQTTELEKLQNKLSGLEAEQAKQIVATKVAIQEKTRALNEEAKANNAAYQARQKDVQASKDAIISNKESVKATAALLKEKKEEEKQLALLLDDYALLSKAYDEAARRAKNFQIQMGANSPTAKQATADAAKLGAELKRLDASVGQHTRNVGDYGKAFNGLDLSIQQVLREAPSAAISLNTFFLAISNNLPIFFDNLKNVNQGLAGVKEAAAAANIELQKQTATQQAAGAAAETAEEALSTQVETLVGSIGASSSQAAAIKDQIAAHTAEASTTEVASVATVANTETILVNSGATVEQVAAIELQIAATAAATRTSVQQTTALEAQTVATAEANAASKATPGIMALIGRSLFSVSTLLTVAVLALTLFGGKLVDFIGELISGKDALKGFDDALKENIKTFNNESAELSNSLRIIQSNTTSRADLRKEIEKVKSQYPEYLGFLTEENRLTRDVSDAIQLQIDAMRRRAIEQSYIDVYKKSLEKVTELENDLVRIAGGGSTVFERLSSSGNGTALKIDILKDKTQELNEAIADTQEAYAAASNPLGTFVKKIEEEIEKNKELIATQEKYIDSLEKEFTASPKLFRDAEKKISLARQYIKEQQEIIDNVKKIGARDPIIPDFALTQAEIGQKRIEAAMLASKKGSKAALDLAISNEVALDQVAVNALKERYIKTNKVREEDLKGNQSYLAELALQEAKTGRKIQDLKDEFNKPKKVKDSTNKDVQLVQDNTKAIADELAKRALLEGEQQKLIADNEENELGIRLDALRFYYDKKAEALKISSDGEILANKKVLDAISLLEKKKAGGGELTSQEKDLINEKQLVTKKITNIELESQINRTKNQQDFNKAINSLVSKASQDELTEIFRRTDAIATARSEQFAREKEALEEQYDQRKLSVKEYNNALKALNTEYVKDTYTLQIEALNNEILFSQLTQEEIDKVIAKIKELEKARNDIGKSGVKRGEDGGILGFTEKDKKDLANINSYVDAASAAFQGLSDVLDQISEKRRAQTEAEMDAIDKRTQKEIDGINASSLTQEQKDKKTLETQAKADAQKAALAEKQKQRDIADARRQKALKIAQIIVETALAVIHQLGSGDPYTAIARGIAAGAVGAAQLAVAIATPIPSFAEGTNYFGGGLARYAEAGPEVVAEPGKAPYWVTKETVSVLPKGTRIIPEEKVFSSAYSSMLHPDLVLNLEKNSESLQGVEERLDRWGSRQISAINSLKSTPVKKSIFGSQNLNWINS